MPEYPDVIVYVECLTRMLTGMRLERLKIAHPFVLRSVSPTVDDIRGKRVRGTRRIGKQIVIELDGDLFIVIHLMIAGRLRWETGRVAAPKKLGLCSFEFVSVESAGAAGTDAVTAHDVSDNGPPAASGTLVFTEAGTKKRASLHLVAGTAALEAFGRGGVDVLDVDLPGFRAALQRENHTVKRTLTDPRLISGIGNAYSDEILHRARISPFKQTRSFEDREIEALFAACRDVLTEWADRLRSEARDGFPAKVTAFRPEMAVHGKYGKPCPVCGTAVQRIVYAENESNYCPTCQTGGKLLADRALSRLLKEDWPATLTELEEMKTSLRNSVI